MVKGIIGSLIAAAVFFTAGGISVAVLGYRDGYIEGFCDNELFGEDILRENILLQDEVGGSLEEMFGFCGSVGIYTSGVNTYVGPADGGEVTLSVECSGGRKAAVTVAEGENDDRDVLGISVSGRSSFFGSGSVTVHIGLPDTVYNALEMRLGSGAMYSKGLKAESSVLDISSGSFELAFAENFRAYNLSVNVDSGSAAIANAAADNYNIEMSSGKLDIGGLCGSGKIDISSGTGTAEFASLDGHDHEIELSSGKLDVYIPENTAADLYTWISSGSVTANCCGVSKKLKDGDHITLNGGFENRFDDDYDHDREHGHDHDDDHPYVGGGNCGTIIADVSSGKIALYNSSEYAPSKLKPFPGGSPTAAVEEVTITDNKVEQYG